MDLIRRLFSSDTCAFVRGPRRLLSTARARDVDRPKSTLLHPLAQHHRTSAWCPKVRTSFLVPIAWLDWSMFLLQQGRCHACEVALFEDTLRSSNSSSPSGPVQVLSRVKVRSEFALDLRRIQQSKHRVLWTSSGWGSIRSNAQIEAWSLERKSVLDCIGETCASSRASCHTNMVNDRGKTEMESQCPSHSSQPEIWERIGTGITLFLFMFSFLKDPKGGMFMPKYDAGGSRNPIKKLASLSCHKLDRYLKKHNSQILLGRTTRSEAGFIRR